MFKKKICEYTGPDTEEIMEAYCYKCKAYHKLPKKNWKIVYAGKAKCRLQCDDSLDKKRRK